MQLPGRTKKETGTRNLKEDRVGRRGHALGVWPRASAIVNVSGFRFDTVQLATGYTGCIVGSSQMTNGIRPVLPRSKIRKPSSFPTVVNTHTAHALSSTCPTRSQPVSAIGGTYRPSTQCTLANDGTWQPLEVVACQLLQPGAPRGCPASSSHWQRGSWVFCRHATRRHRSSPASKHWQQAPYHTRVLPVGHGVQTKDPSHLAYLISSYTALLSPCPYPSGHRSQQRDLVVGYRCILTCPADQ